MGKQLKLTKKEQETVSSAISAVSLILFDKVKKGVQNPEIEANFEIVDHDFSIRAHFTVVRGLPSTNNRQPSTK